MAARIKKVGDLWAGLRKAKGIDLERITRLGQNKKKSR
jgi:hypothetical protein